MMLVKVLQMNQILALQSPEGVDASLKDWIELNQMEILKKLYFSGTFVF